MALRFALPLVCSCIAAALLCTAQSIASAFTVDTAAPQTTIDSGPSGSTSDNTPTFAFSSSETDSTFECSLDSGSFAPCTSPTTLGPLANGVHSLAVKATGRFETGYLSPALTDSHQGYATDGTYHYLIGTNSIQKRNDDATWSLVAENLDANAGLPATHLGDADYYGGYLYVPSELLVSCSPGDVSQQSILVFRASDLSRVAVHDISAQGHEASGIAVAPDIGANGTIFVTDYCDPLNIYEYDLSTFAYLGDLLLSQRIFTAQGIAYRDGWLYASSTDNTGPGRLYVIDPLTGATTLVYTSDHVAKFWEGIDYSQNTLRLTLDYGDGTEKVQYLSAGNTDASAAVRFFTVVAMKGRIFAHLTKKNFKRSQTGKVRLVYRFSPHSKRFSYVLARTNGARWLTVRGVIRRGNFKGSHSMTIKELFARKPMKTGRYRLMLSADANRKVLAFEIE